MTIASTSTLRRDLLKWLRRKEPKRDPHDASWRPHLPSTIPSSFQHFYPGTPTPGTVAPGDLVLVHCSDRLGRAITVGQRIRFKGKGIGHWDHCAIAVGDGKVMHATERGLRRDEPAKFDRFQRTVVQLGLTDEQREIICAYLDRVEHYSREKYSWPTAFGLFLRLLNGSAMTISTRDTFTCSQLVSDALGHAGVFFERSPAGILPADIAVAFRVPLPVGDPYR